MVIEFVRINGTAVRVTSLSRRMVGGTTGIALREMTLVIIARGEQTHHAVLDLAGSVPGCTAGPAPPRRALGTG